MRIAITTLAVLVLTFGAFSLARGDDDAAGKTAAGKKAGGTKAVENALVKMQAEMTALRMEVGYLRDREAALSAYILKNDERGRGLQAVVQRARAAGFEANRIPVDSRKILLGGLEAAAVSIGRGLPALTESQAGLLKKLAAFRKANGLKE